MPGGPEFGGQNTWKIRSEGQITSTSFLQQWTRLPVRDQIVLAQGSYRAPKASKRRHALRLA